MTCSGLKKQDSNSMTVPIHIGDRGQTLGPLKPTGRIDVNGSTISSSSEGGWIDAETDVVIVGGNQGQAIVRAFSSDASLPQDNGVPLPEENEIETDPQQSPPAFVERVNSVAIGLLLGVVLVPIVWSTGTSFSSFSYLMPVSGLATGWLFRMFVGTAIQTVGPNTDHRPTATMIALTILLCCGIGTVIALDMGLGFLGLSYSLPLSALAGGMACIGLMLAVGLLQS
jgi:hypothetical protein